MAEYPCDVCKEIPARFWNDDKGAVCEGCNVPTWKANEIITVENKYCGCYTCAETRAWNGE